MASTIKTFDSKGRARVVQQKSNLAAALAASMDPTAQMRARISADRGIKGSGVRVTNPRTAGYTLQKKRQSLGMGGV